MKFRNLHRLLSINIFLFSFLSCSPLKNSKIDGELTPVAEKVTIGSIEEGSFQAKEINKPRTFYSYSEYIPANTHSIFKLYSEDCFSLNAIGPFYIMKNDIFDKKKNEYVSDYQYMFQISTSSGGPHEGCKKASTKSTFNKLIFTLELPPRNNYSYIDLIASTNIKIVKENTTASKTTDKDIKYKCHCENSNKIKNKKVLDKSYFARNKFSALKKCANFVKNKRELYCRVKNQMTGKQISLDYFEEDIISSYDYIYK